MESFLVATQISSLFPSQATSISLQTTRQGVPLPPAPQESDPPTEHATFSSLLHTPVTGTILLRLLHGGLIIELISLSTEVSPIRFIFPAVIIPSPAMFLWNSTELHVLAVTQTGSLYRLVIPVDNSHELWRNHGDNIWPREYLIKNISDTINGVVHAQGTDCVAIGLPDGSLLRLETEYIGQETDGKWVHCKNPHLTVNGTCQDEWAEYFFQSASFLSSLTSFLPTLSSGSANGSEIVSMATHPWPTDIGHIWTLSRDLTVRYWKAKIGCITSKPLAHAFHTRESSPSPAISANGTKPHVLLDSMHQTLLRVFSVNSHEDHIYVLVFIPTITSLSSGGTFQLLGTVADQLCNIGVIECSKNTAHCHLQDFIVIGDFLYTLWDRQGQSMIERTDINFNELDNKEFRLAAWYTASYATEPELTPAYLEEHLLSPGSLTDKFFEAIMRPGVFSALTLRTAIDQYTDACLSLPGPRPPQLATTYASLSEHIAAVVGCTVSLNRDPQTGAFQYANYWNALKRDWEGFIARCREVERSARRPLVLGVQGQGDVVIVERERVGALVNADLPIQIRSLLSRGWSDLDSQYDLLSVLWTLRSKLGPQAMSNLENRLMDIVHQEVAFSFVDILQDQARRSKFREAIDEGSASWIIGRLQSINDIDTATRTVLDVIGGFDMEIKREEDEVELLLPPPHSHWSRALAAAYITKTIEARYDLCLSLVTLLFFLSDELSDWDPALLAEVFAVFRGMAMLRYVAKQPAGPSSDKLATCNDHLTPDDVVSRMRSMNVSQNKTLITPTYSLIHRLLAQSSDTHGFPGAAHRFLDATGLLQSVSPAHATKFEVLFCERLRLLGFYGAARELLSWLPRTPGASYVLARLWLNMGRADDAAHLMERLAASFGKSPLAHVFHIFPDTYDRYRSWSLVRGSRHFGVCSSNCRTIQLTLLLLFARLKPL